MQFFSIALIALVLGSTTACGASSSSRSTARLFIEGASSELSLLVWDQLSDRARELGLVLTELHPEKGLLKFDWITAPGDARLYLRCDVRGSVGSASLRPTLRVESLDDGVRIVISSEVRATTPALCESNGRFERWLLGQLHPAPLVTDGEAAVIHDPR